MVADCSQILTLALSGGVACILAYGQTGSGKTFTMESLEHRIARDLFDHARAVGERLLLAQGRTVDASNAAGVFEISATFLELMGKRASDLLEATETVDAQGNPLRAEVPIREDNVRLGLLNTIVVLIDTSRPAMYSPDSCLPRFAHLLSWRRSSGKRCPNVVRPRRYGIQQAAEAMLY